MYTVLVFCPGYRSDAVSYLRQTSEEFNLVIRDNRRLFTQAEAAYSLEPGNSGAQPLRQILSTVRIYRGTSFLKTRRDGKLTS